MWTSCDPESDMKAKTSTYLLRLPISIENEAEKLAAADGVSSTGSSR